MGDYSKAASQDRKNEQRPTVSRVAADTLVELVYDPRARTTALVVSRFGGLWNIEQEGMIGGEVLVPYAAANNLIANECVLLPSKPAECGQKAELIADIRASLHRYGDLSSLFEPIAAYYVLLSWVHDAFDDVPCTQARYERVARARKLELHPRHRLPKCSGIYLRGL